jgi:putative phosphoribosyl transferase
MHLAKARPMFNNRYDAGRQLAVKLTEYRSSSTIVLAIPNGGVPVALEVAIALGANLDLIISRKIPLPLRPEAGFGAVSDDGTVILNQEIVDSLDLSPRQINYQVNKVKADIRQRSLLYHKDRPLPSVEGKTVIIVDDGLASGFTMMAAVESLRHRQPKRVVVAVPAASIAAVKRLEEVADKVVTCTVGFMPKFYIADFYRNWYDLSDDEVMQCLKEWRVRYFKPNISLPQDR